MERGVECRGFLDGRAEVFRSVPEEGGEYGQVVVVGGEEQDFFVGGEGGHDWGSICFVGCRS